MTYLKAIKFLSYLMQCSQAIDICCVDVSPSFNQFFNLIFIRGCTSGKEDAPISELDPGLFPFGLRGLMVCVGLPPTL